MNTYIADRIARDHLDALAADATRARRVRSARRARRSRPAHTRNGAQFAEHTATHRPAARRLTRPFAAVHAWIAAGEL
jgi:hypothetical protein